MYEKVVKNKQGYYQLREKPSREILEDTYINQCYQEHFGSYAKEYSAEEKRFFENQSKKKEYIIKRYIKKSQYSFLDICCGEGFLLNYLFQTGQRDLLGIDLSGYGVREQNPQISHLVKTGDCYKILDELYNKKVVYDVINIDLALCSLYDPKLFIDKCRKIMTDTSIFIIKEANQYSDYRKSICEKGIVSDDAWISPHITNYFDKESLKELFEDNGYQCVGIWGDSFIDLNLLNSQTNYYKNKKCGKDCHTAEMELEEMAVSSSIDKWMDICSLMADLGFGRCVVEVFKKVQK
ncbi:MAG: class I SAM-dependent methyltransferase [Dorea sp.]|nr:class I SAM-dependent methyltransferase [Dorea sp.]